MENNIKFDALDFELDFEFEEIEGSTILFSIEPNADDKFWAWA